MKKSYLFKSLCERLADICVPGTLNITRIRMRNVMFKIEDRFEEELKNFNELESYDTLNVDLAPTPSTFPKAELPKADITEACA